MKTTEEYLHILRNGKAYLMQYHIMRLGIFGSVVILIDKKRKMIMMIRFVLIRSVIINLKKLAYVPFL